MGRRKKRQGGRHAGRGDASGRVTPRGTRPEERSLVPVAFAYDDTDARLDLLIRDASHIVEEHPSISGIDEVDRWASAIQFEVRSPASPGGLRAPIVLARAASTGGPAGAALAAAIAVYGPVDQRDRARRTLDRLMADSPDVPAWVAAVGAAEPVRAVKLTDEWDEYTALDIDFRRPSAGTHRLRIGIQPFRGGMAHPFACFANGDKAAAVSFRSEEISLADARAIAEPGIEILEELISDAYDHPDLDLDPSHELFALVRQRISLLPPGGTAPERPQHTDEELAAPFAEFAGRPLGYGEDHDNFYHLMRSLIGFVASCWDHDPLRWTPPKVTAFLEEWLPDNGYHCPGCRHLHEPPSYEEWLPTFRSGFLRWLRLTAALGNLPDDTREANLAAAKTSLKDLTRRVAAEDHHAALNMALARTAHAAT